MKKILKYKLLILIIFIACVARLYKLGEVPVGPNWDEAALGYNAFSILNTGKDEYGTRLPLSLRSYDDYKPPLYMYLTVPSVAIFDLSLWSTRLPAAINGILAVIGVYFLVKELINFSTGYKKITWLPYLSALLLAVSPWHLQFSRMAFEANIGVTLNIWGACFLIRGLGRGRYLAFSAFLLGLSLYAYHSQRIFMPLLLIVAGIIFWKELLKRRKDVLLALIVGIITTAPLIPVFLNPTSLTRLKGTSAISDTTGLLRDNVSKLERDRRDGNMIGMLLDNRRIVFGTTLLNGYLSHFSLRWLFIDGDNARHHAPGMGLLYILELPFLLIGVVGAAKYGKKFGLFVLSWMLIAPVAASPTTELPHAIRTMVFLPTFQILISIGIYHTYVWVKKIRLVLKLFVVIIFLLAALLNISYYISSYYTMQNLEFSEFWQYGYKDAVKYANEHRNEYKKIIVSTKLEQPHMFFLFFLRYDPKLYIDGGGTSSGGFAEYRNKFDIYEFRPIKWDQEVRDGTILYIGTPSEIPGESLMPINYLSGKEAIKIAR